MVRLTDKYHIPAALDSCSEYLLEHLSPNNVTNSIRLATTFTLDKLNVECKRIIRTNTEQVLASEAFQKCPLNALSAVLSIASFSCDEEIVFDACIEWARLQCKDTGIDATKAENLRAMLGDCFSLIRFKEIRRRELGQRLKLYADMFTKEEIVDFYCEPELNGPIKRRSDIVFEFSPADAIIPETTATYDGPIIFHVTELVIMKGLNLSINVTPPLNIHDFTISVAITREMDDGHDQKLICPINRIFETNPKNEFELYIEFARNCIKIEPNVIHSIALKFPGQFPCIGYKFERRHFNGIDFIPQQCGTHFLVNALYFERFSENEKSSECYGLNQTQFIPVQNDSV